MIRNIRLVASCWFLSLHPTQIHSFKDSFHMHNTRTIGKTFLRGSVCTNSPSTGRIRVKSGRYTLNIRRGYLILLALIKATGRRIGFSDFFYCTSRPPPKWPCGLRHGSAAACLLGLRVRILPGGWMFVSCYCCVLSPLYHPPSLLSQGKQCWWLILLNHKQ